MKINFIVSKNTNKFFFIQNLAEWHYSCRKIYNKDWLQQTGLLTTKEKEILREIKTILGKRGFTLIGSSEANNIFDYFLRFEEIGDKNQPVTQKELVVYHEVMDIFEPRFEKIWQTQKNNFEKVQTEIFTKYKKTEKSIIKDFAILFGKLAEPKAMKVYLLLSTLESGGGGGANGPNVITLECSSMSLKYVNDKLSILWHELTHHLLRNYIKETADILNQNKYVKKASKKADEIHYNYSQELLAYSIFTNGSFFSQKYFPTTFGKDIEKAARAKDYQWFIEHRLSFPIYLIYLNGQYMKKKLAKKETIIPKEMARAIFENHKKTEEYYKQHNSKVSWFGHS